MKKKLIIAFSILILILIYVVSTGFAEKTDVVLMDYSVSDDETEMTMTVGASEGYIRNYNDVGGGIKPHYITFYSTYGGLKSSIGAIKQIQLELGKDDTEIYFKRSDGGYELILHKDEESGQWIIAEQAAIVPMVMVNGELYYDTGRECLESVVGEVYIGEITSMVDASKEPSEDNQSNFGIGYKYRYREKEKTVDVYIGDKWWIFLSDSM